MQVMVDGFQHEQPDYWLNFGNPWEIERLNVGYTIKFYGHVSVVEENGRQVFRWIPGDSVSLCSSCSFPSCYALQRLAQTVCSHVLSANWHRRVLDIYSLRFGIVHRTLSVLV